jgi:uncharacterized lipoprotein YajG
MEITMLIKPYRLVFILLSLALLAGCVTGTPDAPSTQTTRTEVVTEPSDAVLARSAYEFEDEDIRVPAFFDTQGLSRCTFDPATESDACPLKKKIIRVYFNEDSMGGEGVGVEALGKFDSDGLVDLFEAQFAGINRYRIVTRDDDVVAAEQATLMEQQGAEFVAERSSSNGVLAPDLIVVIDTLRTARTESSIRAWMNYTFQMTARVLNPSTREVMSHPNIGKITVTSEDVRTRDELSFIRANGEYLTGFEYHKDGPVSAVLNDMASRGFDIMLTRLLSEMPATAQVVGLRDNQLSLDRGQNAGVLPNETMIIFESEAGFVTPIGVANVNPSMNSAQGEMVRWKNNDQAKRIRGESNNGIYRPSQGAKVFGVSVGTPPNFLDDRT